MYSVQHFSLPDDEKAQSQWRRARQRFWLARPSGLQRCHQLGNSGSVFCSSEISSKSICLAYVSAVLLWCNPAQGQADNKRLTQAKT